MEPNTPRLLHASIAVFYDTIHAVANASNLAARLGDLQAFLDDLVKTSFSDHKGKLAALSISRLVGLTSGLQNRATLSTLQSATNRTSTSLSTNS